MVTEGEAPEVQNRAIITRAYAKRGKNEFFVGPPPVMGRVPDDGLKAAIANILCATWQRCRVHFMRNAIAHAGKTQRRIVSAWVGTAFAQGDAATARQRTRYMSLETIAQLSDDPSISLPRLAA